VGNMKANNQVLLYVKPEDLTEAKILVREALEK